MKKIFFLSIITLIILVGFTVGLHYSSYGDSHPVVVALLAITIALSSAYCIFYFFDKAYHHIVGPDSIVPLAYFSLWIIAPAGVVSIILFFLYQSGRNSTNTLLALALLYIVVAFRHRKELLFKQ